MASRQKDTVEFNVGGHIFEVLHEPTLALHPGSLLKQLADDAVGDAPIFVEADPELFKYMLAYHRRRQIHIPCTVSKQAVLQEAMLLGLPVQPEDIVQESLPLRELGHFTAEALKIQGMSGDTKEGKLSCLASLVVKSALAKAGRSATIEVSTQDLLQMEGTMKKLCCLSSTYNCDIPQTCGQQKSYLIDVNSFEPVMQFLSTGLSADELQWALEPWAQINGFKVEVQLPSNGSGAGYQYPRFLCKFT